MRAEVIFDSDTKGKFDFVVAPRTGDTVQLKDETATVSEFAHNLDLNRLQVLCALPSRPVRNVQPTRQQRVITPEPEPKKDS